MVVPSKPFDGIKIIPGDSFKSIILIKSSLVANGMSTGCIITLCAFLFKHNSIPLLIALFKPL